MPTTTTVFTSSYPTASTTVTPEVTADTREPILPYEDSENVTMIDSSGRAVDMVAKDATTESHQTATDIGDEYEVTNKSIKKEIRVENMENENDTEVKNKHNETLKDTATEQSVDQTLAKENNMLQLTSVQPVIIKTVNTTEKSEMSMDENIGAALEKDYEATTEQEDHGVAKDDWILKAVDESEIGDESMVQLEPIGNVVIFKNMK